MERYDEYKETGIDWIGQIPISWEIKKVAWLFKTIGSGTTPKASDEKYYFNGTIPWLLTGDLNDAEIHETSKKITSDAIKEYSTLKKYPIDSIVIAMYGATIGKLGILKTETTVNQACCVLAEPKNLNLKYAFYFLLATRKDIINLSYGGGQPNISQDTVRSLKLPYPSFEEQTQIAIYLDTKTAEIDNIIAAKKKLIALYEEEKAAVINHAVTKGINPDVKLKPSGVEWLGDIPEHWEVKKIGHCAKIVRGGSPRPTGDPRYFFGDYIHWITVKEVTSAIGKYVTGTEEFLTEEGSKLSRIIEPETLLLSNSGATLGVPKISKVRGCINDGSVAFPELKPFLHREYLYYFFESHTNIYREQMKGNGQPNLNTEIVKSTFMPNPSTINEQKEIVDFIEAEIERVEAKKSKAKKLIDLLTEYRTTLISEVVTGKIKVTA